MTISFLERFRVYIEEADTEELEMMYYDLEVELNERDLLEEKGHERE